MIATRLEQRPWSWRRRVVVVMTAASIMAGGASVVAPAPADAASCTGNSCNGKDPQTTGCNSSGTVATRFSRTFHFSSGGGWTAQLRYSSGCKAFWGRFIRDDCVTAFHRHRWLRVQNQVLGPDGWVTSKTQMKDMWGTSPCNGGTNWTKMVPGGPFTRARVCWTDIFGDAVPRKWTGCSGWSSGG